MNDWKFEVGDVIYNTNSEYDFTYIVMGIKDEYYNHKYKIKSFNYLELSCCPGHIYDMDKIYIERWFELEQNYLKKKRLEGLLK